jgi:uncharacterized protein YprB with RNaseH-like and TPR domain
LNEPKILYFDIESAGVNALKSDLGFVILFGYKWNYESEAKCISIDSKSLRRFDDSKLLRQASRLLEQADLTVAHFGSVFDRRFIQGRLLINKLPPIPPTKMRDTCMIARSVANFSSNRLKHLARILDLAHKKLENNWPDAWFKVMQGNRSVLHDLAEYCKGDVLALESLYQALRPFDNAHPRLFTDRSKCGKCGGEIQYRGFAYVQSNRYRRFICKNGCGWGRETKKVD